MYSKSYGFSLIEIIVVCAIMSVVSLGFASMIYNSNKELKYVETKMEAIQLKNQFLQAMTNDQYCACAFRNFTVDTAANKLTAQPVSFSNSYDPVTCNPVGGAPIFQTNSQVPSSRLFLGAIRVDNILPDMNPGDYRARVVIPIDQAASNLNRQIKDLEFPIRFTVNTAAVGANKPITNCTAKVGIVAPPGSAAFATDYCYANPTGKGGGGSCADGFYVKSVFSYDDDNWQGVGLVCCYGSTGAPPPAVTADLNAFPTKNICVGCNYSQVVTDCQVNKAKYGPNTGTRCPSSTNISWGVWKPFKACNAPPGCGTVGFSVEQSLCTGSGCPDPATVTRQVQCVDISTCPPPEQP